MEYAEFNLNLLFVYRKNAKVLNKSDFIRISKFLGTLGLVLALCFCSASELSAQLNIKVGYSLGFTSASKSGQIIDLYNEKLRTVDGITLDIPLDNIGTLNGINIGFRYMLSNNGAFELSWENLGSESRAIGETPAAALFEYDIFYTFNQYFFSYQSYFGDLCIGSGIGLNNVKIQERIAGSDNRRNFNMPNQWVARINLSYNFGRSEKVGLALQPYIQFPITKVNMNNLADRLNVVQLTNPNESFITYGLTLVFYNGPQ